MPINRAHWLLRFLGLTLSLQCLVILSCTGGDGLSIEDEFINKVIHPANIEDFDFILIPEQPSLIKVEAMGFFPDGCTSIEDIFQERIGDIFYVTITTFRTEDAICTLALVQFEVTLGIDILGLDSGLYTVLVNDISKSFEINDGSVFFYQ